MKPWQEQSSIRRIAELPAGDDQTTAYTYDGDDDILTQSAVLPGSAFQTTKYIHAASQANGDGLDANNILISIEYPDKNTGAASANEKESYTVNALGERASLTDRNGNVHEYDHDALGRLTGDIVTTLGSGVDGSIRALGYTYNTQGLPDQLTGYSDTSGNKKGGH